MTFKIKALALVVAFAATSQARATVYDLSLTGQTSDFTENNFNFGASHYDQFDLPLEGLDASNAITVSEGDEIDSTVTLDSSYTIPTSYSHTYFLQYLRGSAFPNENTGSTGTITFYNAGSQVASYAYDDTTSGQLSTLNALFAPSGGGFTFDSFINDQTVSALPTPATLNSASIEYDLVTDGAVPEPASWALMITGFGMMGAVARRRSARTAA